MTQSGQQLRVVGHNVERVDGSQEPALVTIVTFHSPS